MVSENNRFFVSDYFYFHFVFPNQPSKKSSSSTQISTLNISEQIKYVAGKQLHNKALWFILESLYSRIINY